MNSILVLFYKISAFSAELTMFLPIYTVLLARIKARIIKTDLKLFEIYVYFILFFEATALILSHGFGLHNVIVFRIFLPIHAGLFSYLLSKWSNFLERPILLGISIAMLLIVVDFTWGDQNYSPDLMTWLDAIFLLLLSFFLSYRIDKTNLKLPCEFNFIHIGIYLYSLITLIGITPTNEDLRGYGFVVQNIAIIVSNIYFARSFRCLYH